MSQNITEQFDVVVIGGGPGGSSVATFIAMQGHKVLLLEREAFPRYQIGESLLPATVNGICAMLGVTEELSQARFTYKRGGTYKWGRHPEPWSFTFGPSTMTPGTQAFAYQVERMKFDSILLDNARRKGVDVRQQCTVNGVLDEDGRAVGVTYTDPKGSTRSARARYVVDGSGNQTAVSRKVGERLYSSFFQNVALFTYFEAGQRLPEPNSGNIFCEAFGDGWFWYIPLTPDLTSVGAVVSRDQAEKLKAGPESAMGAFVDSTVVIRELLSRARRITEGPYGQYRIRKDYSYANTRFWGPGMVLIGDAACFIDPIFSSGVHLATYSGLLAARSINTCLRGDISEERSFREFELRYRKEFSNFYQFLVAFYDMDKDLESYYWSARKVLNTEERSNEAFIRIVAGVSSDIEPVFNAAEFFDARAGAGAIFRRAYEGATNPVQAANVDASRFDANAFLGDFRKSITGMLSQARTGARRQTGEKPIFEDGLIPSGDSLSWVEASGAEAPYHAAGV